MATSLLSAPYSLAAAAIAVRTVAGTCQRSDAGGGVDSSSLSRGCSDARAIDTQVCARHTTRHAPTPTALAHTHSFCIVSIVSQVCEYGVGGWCVDGRVLAVATGHAIGEHDQTHKLVVPPIVPVASETQCRRFVL
jgi:hypothetical protein